MSETVSTWSIVGAGNVGGEIIDMVAKPDVAARLGLLPTPDYVLRRDGWHEHGTNGPIGEPDATKLPDSDVLFVSSPSTPDHEPMRTLMHQQLEGGRIVVTAEKGTLSEHFGELQRFHNLGYWATVGGGTKLLPSLELHTQDPENVRNIHLALNATLTYIFGEVGSGRDLAQVVDASTKLGYAEPGAISPFDVILSEAAGDIPRKLAIVWNTIFPDSKPLSPGVIDTKLLEEDVYRALNEADRYRYLVSLFQERDEKRAESIAQDKLGGFDIVHEGWIVMGGLQRVDRTNSVGRFKGSNGPAAGFYVALGPFDQSTIDGETFLMGTGAGGSTTANAMLDNYSHIKRSR